MKPFLRIIFALALGAAGIYFLISAAPRADDRYARAKCVALGDAVNPDEGYATLLVDDVGLELVCGKHEYVAHWHRLP